MHAASESRTGTKADLVYDTFYSGAIGGSIVALFFLAVDALRAEPLYTPSLMGSVLFRGADAASAGGVDLGMVAAYSLVHFVSFGVLGFLASLAVHEVELRSKHPALVLVVLFLIFEGAFALATTLFMPGVMRVVGPVWVALANLLAAGGMGIFFLAAHEPPLWQRIKHAVGA